MPVRLRVLVELVVLELARCLAVLAVEQHFEAEWKSGENDLGLQVAVEPEVVAVAESVVEIELVAAAVESVVEARHKRQTVSVVGVPTDSDRLELAAIAAEVAVAARHAALAADTAAVAARIDSVAVGVAVAEAVVVAVESIDSAEAVAAVRAVEECCKHLIALELAFAVVEHVEVRRKRQTALEPASEEWAEVLVEPQELEDLDISA